MTRPLPALYLYAISRASRKPIQVTSPGIDGLHPVGAVACGKFTCWVSPVGQEEFAQSMERNMENLEWLALHSVRHQQVVGELAAAVTVIPARFGTIFSGGGALTKDVQRRQRALEKVFRKIEDSDEWGVKVFAEETAPAPVSVPTASGTDYLRQKAARLKRPAEQKDPELTGFRSELQGIAVAAAASGKISGGQPGLLWQSSFLLPRGRRKQWDRTLQKFVVKWQGRRRIEVNGPWPPYSFVTDAE